MKSRIYHAGGDEEFLMIWDDSGKPTAQHNKFVFAGFSDKLHPYYKKQWEWIRLILACRAVLLNHLIVPTVTDMTIDGDDQITTTNLKVPKYITEMDRHASPDGNTYVVVMDEEMGRGWAVFMIIRKDGSKEILQEDHRDNILSWFMDGEFIRSMGIDYERKELPDLNNIPKNVSEA